MSEKMIQIPEWKMKTIENALRLTHRICECSSRESAFDREVVKAYDYAKEALKSEIIEDNVGIKKYLAFDAINGDYNDFETIEKARKWLEEMFFDSEEGYHPEIDSCKIYKLKETVGHDVIDSKENYKYIYEDDIPEDDTESEAWPHNTDFDEIWKHKFIPVS